MTNKRWYVYHKSLGELVVEKDCKDKEDSANWFFERSWRVWSNDNEYEGNPYETVLFDNHSDALEAMSNCVIGFMDAIQDEGRTREL